MINPIQLERMRQTARERLPELAAIERLNTQSDGHGGENQEYEPHQSNIPCRLSYKSASDDANQNAAQGQIKISFPAGTDIAESDRITVGGQKFAVSETVIIRSQEITRDVAVKKI